MIPDSTLPPQGLRRADIADQRDGCEQLLVDYAHLQRRLATMPVIEQAKGVLIGRFGIDADTAFALLRRWSSCTNVKLRDLSQVLVDTASARAVDAVTQTAAPGRSRTALDQLLDDLISGHHTYLPDDARQSRNEYRR